MATGQPAVPKLAQRPAPVKGRWRSFVAVGLIIAPFLPASNLFFWVWGSSCSMMHALLSTLRNLPDTLPWNSPRFLLQY